jgi:gamma-glutamyltranspeptidase/glutathione hydrolase
MFTRLTEACRCAAWLVAFLWLAPTPPGIAQDRSQGRSMVLSRGGIVAAENPLAAEAGAEILARGGNAVDAIVAANAAMGVLEPMMNGMGGDLFRLQAARR